MELNYLFGINSVFPSPNSRNLNCTTLPNENLSPTFKLVTTTEYLILNASDNNAESESTTNLIEWWWQAFDKQYLLHSLSWTCIIVLSYVVILIAGLLGNSLVILAHIYRPKMRTVTNLFIMHLAIADFLVVLFCFLGNLLTNIIKPWILGWFMCKAVSYIQGISVCASAWLLAAISVDRCKAIYRPLDRPAGLRRRHAIFAVVMIWCLALCLPLPWTVTLKIVHKELTYCVELWENRSHGKTFFLCVNVFAFYALPSVFIIVTNIMIWYRLSRRKVPQSAASVIAIRHLHRQTKNDVRKMLWIVTAIFLVSWLPLYILAIRYKYFDVGKSEKKILKLLLPFAQYLGSCNSSINPLLYTYFNRKFREVFQSLVPSCQKIWHRIVPSGVTERANEQQWDDGAQAEKN